MTDLATRFRAFAIPACTDVDAETAELFDEVEAALRERDRLLDLLRVADQMAHYIRAGMVHDARDDAVAYAIERAKVKP